MSRLAQTSPLVHALITPEKNALNIEKARGILSLCTSVPAARDVRDKAKAVAVYLRAKRSGMEAENDAREIVLRAERRMKELVIDDPARAKAGGNRKRDGVKSTPSLPKAATLEEYGVDKEEAKRLRQHANVTDDVFEEHVRLLRELGERLLLSRVAAPPDSMKKGYDGDESFTPTLIVDDVRYVLGEIDLDPFSCAAAQARVLAKRHYTKDQNAITRPWKGRVFFQPPYSKDWIDQAVDKLLRALKGGDAYHDVTDCVGLTNKSEAAWWHKLARKATAICETGGLEEDGEDARGRINFDQPDGKGGIRKTKSNRFAQTFFYFGSRLDRFEERFEKRGTIFTPRPRRLVEAT